MNSLLTPPVKIIYRANNYQKISNPFLQKHECTLVITYYAFTYDLSDYGIHLDDEDVSSYFKSSVGPVKQDFRLRTFVNNNLVDLPTALIFAVHDGSDYLIFVICSMVALFNSTTPELVKYPIRTNSIIISSYFHYETKSLVILTYHSIEIYDIICSGIQFSLHLRSIQLDNLYMGFLQISPIKIKTRKVFPSRSIMSRSSEHTKRRSSLFLSNFSFRRFGRNSTEIEQLQRNHSPDLEYKGSYLMFAHKEMILDRRLNYCRTANIHTVFQNRSYSDNNYVTYVLKIPRLEKVLISKIKGEILLLDLKTFLVSSLLFLPEHTPVIYMASYRDRFLIVTPHSILLVDLMNFIN